MSCVVYLHGSQLHFLLQFQYIFPEYPIGIHQVFDRLAGMDHSSMVTATKMLPDGFEGILGKCLGQVHGNLAGLNDFPFPCLLEEFIVRHIEILANHVLDGFDRNFLAG